MGGEGTKTMAEHEDVWHRYKALLSNTGSINKGSSLGIIKIIRLQHKKGLGRVTTAHRQMFTMS